MGVCVPLFFVLADTMFFFLCVASHVYVLPGVRLTTLNNLHTAVRAL